MRTIGLCLIASALLLGPATALAQDAVTADAPDRGSLDTRVRDLQFRSEELGSDIARARRALGVLAMQVFEQVDGAVVSITHENRMGPFYRLVRATYALDGVPVFSQADATGVLGERESFDVFRGSVSPGEHALSVHLEYVGHGGAVFRYLEGYRFRLDAPHTFTAPAGRTVRMRVRAIERGGPTTSYIDRPAVDFAETLLGR